MSPVRLFFSSWLSIAWSGCGGSKPGDPTDAAVDTGSEADADADADTDADSDADSDTDTPGCGTDVNQLAIGDLVISEILSSSSVTLTSDGQDPGDWIELYNASATSIELLGLILTDGTDFREVLIDVSLCIPAGAFAVLGVTADVTQNGGIPVDFAWGRDAEYTLGDTDTVRLRDRSGRQLDEVAYIGEDLAWPNPIGASIALDLQRPGPIDNDDPYAWCPGTVPYGEGNLGTPGTENPPCAERITVNALLPGDLVVTEILADPTRAEDLPGEWFEIYNAHDITVDLRDLVLTKCPLDPFGGCPTADTLDNSYLLGPRELVVVAGATDLALNGQLVADLHGSLFLDEVVDTFALFVADTAQLVDVVAWDTAAGWPMSAGVAMQLDPASFDAEANDLPAAWCPSTQPYGLGDLGTPGLANDGC